MTDRPCFCFWRQTIASTKARCGMNWWIGCATEGTNWALPIGSARLLTAPSKAGQGRLMLTSWQLLLDTIAQRTKKDGDAQPHALKSPSCKRLAASAIAGAGNPRFDENLRQLIRDAVERVEQSDWANTDRLTAGVGHDYYARRIFVSRRASAGPSHPLQGREAADRTILAPLWLWLGLPRPHRQSECGGGAQQIGPVGRSRDWDGFAKRSVYQSSCQRALTTTQPSTP